jgi:RNA recognition motif-containing protein
MHKGYTFIQYDNVESAEQAIRECKGYVLGGKPIDCQLAKGGQNAQRNENLGKRKHEDERENFRSRSPQYSGPPPQKRLREDELPAKPANAIPIYILSPALKLVFYIS